MLVNFSLSLSLSPVTLMGILLTVKLLFRELRSISYTHIAVCETNFHFARFFIVNHKIVLISG